jgi:hypothetical protein
VSYPQDSVWAFVSPAPQPDRISSIVASDFLLIAIPTSEFVALEAKYVLELSTPRGYLQRKLACRQAGGVQLRG